MSPSNNEYDRMRRTRSSSLHNRGSAPESSHRPQNPRSRTPYSNSGYRRNDNLGANSRSRNNIYNERRHYQDRPVPLRREREVMPDKNRVSDKKLKKRKKIGALGIIMRVLILLVVISCFAGAGALIGAYIGIIENSPKLELMSIEPNVYTSIIYDSSGNEIDRLHGDENREYITLDKIPDNMQKAIISIEDARFYTHNGIDLRGIARAIYSKLKGNRLEGASTITQQLIKNNVTKVTRNTFETKLQEQYLAIKYEKALEKQLGSKKAAKDYILELYLNTIYLGRSYNGVQAAALGYFNKNTSELTLAECAVMAGITNNPSYYSPSSHPENNKKRQLKILKNMLEQGYITDSQYNEATGEDVFSKVGNYSSGYAVNNGNAIHSYFVDALFEQLSKDLQNEYNMSVAQANNYIYNGGLKVESTIDTKMQKIVDEAYLNNELFPNVTYSIDVSYLVSIEDSSTGNQEHSEYKQFVKSKEAADEFVANKKSEIEKSLTSTQTIIADKANYVVQPQSAMVIMDYRTGEVKALTGGRGEKTINRGLNRAVDSARQPGSVFKVLAAFAPGIDMGRLTPATVMDDVPVNFNGYKPKNWYSNPPYRGLSTIREGVKDSMNIVAVKSMIHTGIDASYEYLLNFGFTTLENDNHASTALGGLTHGVTQLEVTAAYSTIANGGEYNKPILYTKVYDHNGKVLLENKSEPKRILKETSAFLLTNMMRDVVTGGTGTKARFKNTTMPIAGKTGTAQDSRDLTFVGYTPYYAAGIWFGYDRYDDTVSNMSRLNQQVHLELWRYIMERVHEGLEVKNFAQPPDGIVTASICMESGKLASSGLCDSDPRGSRVRSEYFAQGTQPTQHCDVHKRVSYCSVSGKLSNEFCPSESISSNIGIVRPTPYTGSENIADKQYEIPAGALNGAVCDVHTAEGTVKVPEEGDDENKEENTENNNSNSDLPDNNQNDNINNNQNNDTNTNTNQNQEQDTNNEPPKNNTNPGVIDGGGIVTPSSSYNKELNETPKPEEKPAITTPSAPDISKKRADLSIDEPM